jgi:type I restriction-modification system DNA methylase subunit
MKQSIDDRLGSARPVAAVPAAQADHSPRAIKHRNNIIKMIEQLSRRHSRWETFRDFVTMCAVALSKLDTRRAEDREKLYMRCVGRYNSDEARLFAHMFAELQMGMEADPRDILGEVYMMMELGNQHVGQFFTPYHICKLMAGLTLARDPKELIAKHGFITVCEPASGAGAMLIALMEAMRERGVAYQQSVHVTATDLDSTAAMMTYVQLSLLHVPAIVVHGNTLTLEEFDHWYTPAHIIGNWSGRLARQVHSRIDDNVPDEDPDVELYDEACESSGPSP